MTDNIQHDGVLKLSQKYISSVGESQQLILHFRNRKLIQLTDADDETIMIDVFLKIHFVILSLIPNFLRKSLDFYTSRSLKVHNVLLTKYFLQIRLFDDYVCIGVINSNKSWD